MRKHAAIGVGKIISGITKKLKIGGGSAAPGLYALKIYPKLIEELISQIPTNILITGTNGKTTTARFLSHFAKASGLKVIRNSTGSNLERGIASTLITSSHMSNGKLKNFDLGIWEVDEAAFNTLAPKIKPDAIIFLNCFRDQLDRYGEVDKVINSWCKTLKNLSQNTKVIINGDDAGTLKLKNCFPGNSLTFGVSGPKIAGEGKALDEEGLNLDFEASGVKILGLSGTSFKITVDHATHNVILPIPGIYHIYDFLSAFLAGIYLKFGVQKMLSSLKDFSPAFGRFEKFSFGYIFLIKNPTGATEVFKTIAPNFKKNDRLLIALNDNLADGRDISWIWDADFEELQNPSLREPECSSEPRMARAEPGDYKIYCSGTRAADLAVRLKYAGFDPALISVESDLKKAFLEAKMPYQSGGRLFILPTYTCLLELQQILFKQGIKEHYWKEES